MNRSDAAEWSLTSTVLMDLHCGDDPASNARDDCMAVVHGWIFLSRNTESQMVGNGPLQNGQHCLHQGLLHHNLKEENKISVQRVSHRPTKA